MKIVVEGDEKIIKNLIREKSILVNRGSISIEVLDEEKEKPEPRAKEKSKPKSEPKSKK